MLDKRSHLRVPVLIPVCCKAADAVSVAGLVIDIGLGGSCVRSEEALPHGAEVTVVARLPGAAHESRMAARVCWTSPGRFGLEFQRLDARDTYRITDLMGEALRAGARLSAYQDN